MGESYHLVAALHRTPLPDQPTKRRCHNRPVTQRQARRETIEPERLIGSTTLVEGKLLVLRHDKVVDAKGEERQREVVGHRGGVAIVALSADRRLLLVRQYRHAVGEVLLEIPAGTLDREPDDSIEDPATAARRELAEETGHVAGEWRALGRFYTAPGFATEEMHLYLATELSEIEDHGGPEEDENLELVRLPIEQALALAVGGELRDAKTLVGVLWLGRLVEAGEV